MGSEQTSHSVVGHEQIVDNYSAEGLASHSLGVTCLAMSLSKVRAVSCKVCHVTLTIGHMSQPERFKKITTNRKLLRLCLFALNGG